MGFIALRSCGGRLWSAISTEWSPAWGGYWASSSTAFLMQIAALIISPAFLTAGWYVILGRVIQYIGPQYCSLTDLTYLTLFFFGGDVLCLVVQALGELDRKPLHDSPPI